MIYTILYLRVYYVKHIMLLTFTTAEKVKTILIFYQIYISGEEYQTKKYVFMQDERKTNYFMHYYYFNYFNM